MPIVPGRLFELSYSVTHNIPSRLSNLTTTPYSRAHEEHKPLMSEERSRKLRDWHEANFTSAADHEDVRRHQLPHKLIAEERGVE